MKNLMTRTLSRREKLLLLLLVLIGVVGLYFRLVHFPIVDRRAEIAAEKEEVAVQMTAAEEKNELYQSMKKELEEIFAMPQDQVTVMPEYDNLLSLMRKFNDVFAGVKPQISFDGVRIEGNIAFRTVRFSFSAGSFAQAREILKNLTGTGYRCLMDSISLDPAGGNLESGALNVSGSITFYEHVSAAQG